MKECWKNGIMNKFLINWSIIARNTNLELYRKIEKEVIGENEGMLEE